MRPALNLTKISSLLIIAFVLMFSLAEAGMPAGENGLSAIAQVEDVRIAYNAMTGKVSFIGADPSRPIAIPSAMAQGLVPEQRALSVVDQFAGDFGIGDPSEELQVMRSQSAAGRLTTRYQQLYKGIPVIAGEMMVNQTSRGALLSINGEISPDLDVPTDPLISVSDARAIGRAAVAKGYSSSKESFETSEPSLWIYDPRLFTPDSFPSALVWRMDVTSIDRLDIDELVLVDATTGAVRLHFNQVDSALNRETYDANNGTTLPGTLRCNESNPTCSGGDSHEVAAHAYAADTYNFYLDHHGRDSIDGAGMTIISTVHYDSSYQNAFWNGSQMVYGDGAGFPLADDVVGHELTHGVTQHESGLFYYYESGAINESLSDVWGEFIDQTNGAGTDTPGVKWEIGEDITGWGAIRDMADPTAFGDPDKMTSTYYFETSADIGDYGFDNGGVHTNSGVNNKAAYLMTDGDIFNGYNVTGLGIDKVAAIYYEVQTHYLISGSGYADLYNFLYQACLNLIDGSEGISSANCQEVQDTVDAVEMDQEPSSNYNPDPALCTGGDFPAFLFFDDLESGPGNWTFGALVGSSSWILDQGYASSGDHMLWGSDEAGVPTDSYAELSVDVPIPAGFNTYLYFRHAFGFENPYWDGGLVDFSTDGGFSWTDLSILFDDGLDYTGTINSCCGNPNGGSEAFVADSHGYVGSRYDLSPLEGVDVRFRWRVSHDGLFYDVGWVVDDVEVYICGTPIFLPIIIK